MRRGAKVLLAIEVEKVQDQAGVSYLLVQSLPGREGTLTKRWRTANGLLTPSESQDLAFHVAQVVVSAIVCSEGVQTALEL